MVLLRAWAGEAPRATLEPGRDGSLQHSAGAFHPRQAR